jgi:L,D-transpeptidase YcbB
MHGRSLIAVSVAGGLALAYAVIVPVAAVAEDVATTEQPAAPTGATPASNPPAPSPATPNAAAPGPSAAPEAEAVAPVQDADPVVASIRSKLGDAALRKGANPADLAALQAFYAERSGPPVWVTPMGISAKAQDVIDEIGKAGDWGLAASAFELPAAGALPKSVDEQASAEIKLQLAVLKYARFARGGRVNPADLSPLLDLDPPLRDPKVVLAEIAASAAPDNYLQSLQPQHEQFKRLRQALLKARGNGEDGAKKPASDADIQRLLINMERWRWMPADLGPVYVQDNVPEFMLYVVKDGKTIHSDKIVVGQFAYATPIFSADMQTVVFNPEWTVPPTIVRENLLPNLRSGGWFGGGSSILSEHGLQVKYNGRTVSPGSINWSSVNMANIAFTQAPGPTNVLGKLKFVYPNKHTVYMHDTIKQGLFDQKVRAIGHNCIRMEKPSKLAEVLLAEDKGWDAKKIDDLIAKGYNTSVNLDHPIPVHTTYFTAVVDDQGKVTSFADIYALDRKLAPYVVDKVVASAAPAADDDDITTSSITPAAKPKAKKEDVAGGIQGLFGE